MSWRPLLSRFASYWTTFRHGAATSIAYAPRRNSVLMGPRRGRASRVLKNSLPSVRRRLQESRQGIPSGNFAVETIVTAQANQRKPEFNHSQVGGRNQEHLGATASRGSRTSVAALEKTLQGKNARLVYDHRRSRC